MTAASIYLLDLDRRIAMRVPGAGAVAEGQHVAVNSLEKDNELLQLDEIRFCRHGYSMLVFTDAHPDGTRYYRLSTPVIEIRRLHDASRSRDDWRDHGHGTS